MAGAAEPGAPRPAPRSAPQTALVIGGGIVGLTTALRLQEAGVQVRLYDPDTEPRGASWGNAGHVAIEQVEPLASPQMVRSAWKRLYPRGPLSLPLRAIGTWGPFALRLLAASRLARFRAGRRALSALLAEAMPAWRRLVRDLDADDLLRVDGHFIVWERDATAAAGRAHWLSAEIGTARARDADAAELAALRALSTAPIVGAVRIEGSGQVADTGRLAERLAARFVALGGTWVPAAIDRLAVEDGRAVALRGATREAADLVVVAAGAASAALLRDVGVAVPLVAERGYHVQAAAHGWPAGMPPVVYEDRSIIVTCFEQGLRVAGFVEFTRRDAAPDAGKWAKLRRDISALGLPMTLPGREWIGARPTLPDYLPAIGPVTGASNLIAAFGHQHLGLTLGPLTGEMVAAMALGRVPAVDPAPFAPGRFGG